MFRMEIPTKFVDKAKFVLGIFTDVETEYDALLRLMSLTFDAVWRRRMLAKIDSAGRAMVLDLACGTGLVTFELARSMGREGMVVGLDLSPAMLTVARRNRNRVHRNCAIELVRAAGEFLPFRAGLFDNITVGLALRNFANKEAVFRESLRVLTRSGWFLSVDFVRPSNSQVWLLYRFHIFRVLPTLGRVVSPYWNRTLTYLANSILIATPPEKSRRLLLEVGFQRTLLEKMSLGVVALIGAQK